jgi:hypothetical protein
MVRNQDCVKRNMTSCLDLKSAMFYDVVFAFFPIRNCGVAKKGRRSWLKGFSAPCRHLAT